MTITYGLIPWELENYEMPDSYIDEVTKIGASSFVKYTGGLYRPITWSYKVITLKWTNVASNVVEQVLLNNSSMAKCNADIVITEEAKMNGTYLAVPGSASMEANVGGVYNCYITLEQKDAE